MVVPTALVDGVGAVVEPAPPRLVNQYMVPMPDAVSGVAVAPRQYDILVVVVGSGVVPGGITVRRNVLPVQPDSAVVPVTVYVIGDVIELTAMVLVRPVVAER